MYSIRIPQRCKWFLFKSLLYIFIFLMFSWYWNILIWENEDLEVAVFLPICSQDIRLQMTMFFVFSFKVLYYPNTSQHGCIEASFGIFNIYTFFNLWTIFLDDGFHTVTDLVDLVLNISLDFWPGWKEVNWNIW